MNSPAGDISAIAKVEVIEEPADAIIVPESIVEGSGLVADPVEGGAKIKRPLPPLDEGSGEDRPLPPPSAEGSGEETSALL